MKAIDKLTDDQVLALAKWIRENGRSWRTKLGDAWMVAGERVSGYAPELQQIRNNHGAEILPKLATKEVLEAGDAVARAYQIGRRVEIQDPDGGTHYVDRFSSDYPDGKPWHLVGYGRFFAAPDDARAWLQEHWNDPAPPEDTKYARMEASFGETE